ncbi:hypothetical protein psal_cds_390 [Pandoravirus salinus]|uniref:Uncharacterized protein n=1 Tax=Pandoravirus salinus TaxID=1349410 RepID=S4W1R5_9VIRU|nr:hypothetical protein psal_cds_390 [Pandoravirus salinus]AGO84080.2 hypothetical protein psal_cds_390 [Pandoravirus salinus]
MLLVHCRETKKKKESPGRPDVTCCTPPTSGRVGRSSCAGRSVAAWTKCTEESAPTEQKGTSVATTATGGHARIKVGFADSGSGASADSIASMSHAHPHRGFGLE